MSLLEDVFLEDEADEAQQLERVIEGDEYDEQQRAPTPDSDGNSVKDDEAEEAKRVDPQAKAKRAVKNPRFVLNPARLTGPRGIQVIPDHFKDFKFKGKGHEKEDLDLILKKLEHWAYRLYPKFEFEDCLKKIETLGKKRPVMVHLTKIRTDQFVSEETVVQRDSSDDEMPVQEEDEFDKLLEQQIALARSTPAPGSVKKVPETPREITKVQAVPKAISSPSINDEQRDRMLRNRQLAEERRLARLKQNTEQNAPISTDIQHESNDKSAEEIPHDSEEHNKEIESNDKVVDKNTSNDFDSLKEISNESAIPIDDSTVRHAIDTNENVTEVDKEISNKIDDLKEVSNTEKSAEHMDHIQEVTSESDQIVSDNNELQSDLLPNNTEQNTMNVENGSEKTEEITTKDNESHELCDNDDHLKTDEKTNSKEVGISDVASVDYVMDVDFSDDF